jgi:hypothetical protein
VPGKNSSAAATCQSRGEISFRFTLVCRRKIGRVHLGFAIRASDDSILVSGHNLEDDGLPEDFEPGVYWIEWRTRLPLPPGQYRLEVGAVSADEVPERADDWQPPQLLEVVDIRARHLPPQGRGEINERVTCHVREAPGPARAC